MTYLGHLGAGPSDRGGAVGRWPTSLQVRSGSKVRIFG